MIFLSFFCKMTLIMLFFYSFSSKITNIKNFKTSVANFEIVPNNLASSFSLFILIMESGVVIFLITPLPVFGYILALLLLAVFTLAIIINLLRDLRTPCNCFGSNKQVISFYDVVRNIGFLIVSILGLLSCFASYNQTEKLEPFTVGFICLAAFGSLIIWLHMRDIVSLFRVN